MKQYISCFVVVLWCAALSAAVEAPMDPPADQGRFSALLGPAVLAWTSPAMDAVNVIDTDVALSKSKVIGVLYSASWCGPCKQFLPVLEEFYHKMNQKNKGRFDIVWVSINRDETEEEFFHYFRSMPWFAVPQDQIPLTLQNTADPFKLSGIPYLVLLDGSDASIITLDGRENVINDRYGVEFPWRSRSLLNWVPSSVKRRLGGLVGGAKARLAAALHPARLLSVARDLLVGAATLAFQIVHSLYSFVLNRSRISDASKIRSGAQQSEL